METKTEKPDGESRFLKIFTVVEKKRNTEFCEGYRLFMCRFGLVPTNCASHGEEVLFVGEIDTTEQLVA